MLYNVTICCFSIESLGKNRKSNRTKMNWRRRNYRAWKITPWRWTFGNMQQLWLSNSGLERGIRYYLTEMRSRVNLSLVSGNSGKMRGRCGVVLARFIVFYTLLAKMLKHSNRRKLHNHSLMVVWSKEKSDGLYIIILL